MNFKFKEMNNDYAREILTWHYDGIYSFYDMEFDIEDLKEFLDNIKNNTWKNKYVAVDDLGKLVGIFSFNIDKEVMEIGLGLSPELTGQGIGEQYVISGIEYGINTLSFKGKCISLSVVAFNLRAIKLYKKVGFKEVSRFIQPINDYEYEFIKMIKIRP